MNTYFLITFIFLLLSYSWAQPHGGPEEEQTIEEQGETESSYTPIDDSQITSDSLLQGLVYIGVQDVTQQAIQDDFLPQGNYQVVYILNAAQNQDSYRFVVEVTNGQGTIADIRFFISYDASTGKYQVTSYEVLNSTGSETTTEEGEVTEVGEEQGEEEKVEEEESEEEESEEEEVEEEEIEEQTEEEEEQIEEGEEQTEAQYVALAPSVADSNPVIRGIIILGIEAATTQAIVSGSLEDSTYQLVDVNSVEQGVENPAEYKFDVIIVNDAQKAFEMNFNLIYDSASNSVQIISVEFSNAQIPIEEETEAEAEIEAEEAETEIEEIEPEEEIIEETPPIIEEEEETIEIEEAEEEQQPAEDKFVFLDVSVAQTDIQIVGILNFESMKQSSRRLLMVHCMLLLMS